MILTREIIDILAPTHGRTSCSDTDPNNGYYNVKETKIQGIVVERNFDPYPRCHRCFLLEHEGYDTTLMDVNVVPDVTLVLKQPKVKVVVEED